jgi:hypothetical protein
LVNPYLFLLLNPLGQFLTLVGCFFFLTLDLRLLPCPSSFSDDFEFPVTHSLLAREGFLLWIHLGIPLCQCEYSDGFGSKVEPRLVLSIL